MPTASQAMRTRNACHATSVACARPATPPFELGAPSTSGEGGDSDEYEQQGHERSDVLGPDDAEKDYDNCHDTRRHVAKKKKQLPCSSAIRHGSHRLGRWLVHQSREQGSLVPVNLLGGYVRAVRRIVELLSSPNALWSTRSSVIIESVSASLAEASRDQRLLSAGVWLCDHAGVNQIGPECDRIAH